MTARYALLIALVATAAGCGSRPDIRYYRLSYDLDSLPTASESSDVVLAIGNMVGDSAYEDPRIVYRTSPYRLDYYYYHRWTSPPGVMVGDFLRDAYDRTGYFKTVVSGFAPEAPVILTGRVAAFEEVDVETRKWIARVKLELQLRDARTGDIVWSRTITEEEPVKTLTPEGLAEAMSEATTTIVANTAPEFVEVARRVRERGSREDKREELLDSLDGSRGSSLGE